MRCGWPSGVRCGKLLSSRLQAGVAPACCALAARSITFQMSGGGSGDGKPGGGHCRIISQLPFGLRLRRVY